MMRKRLIAAAVAILAIGAVSCQKETVRQTPESVALYTHPGKPEMADAGTRAVTIAATSSWTAVSDADWITLDRTSGEKGVQEVILTFTRNTTGAERTGKVTFSAGSYGEAYVLTQQK